MPVPRFDLERMLGPKTAEAFFRDHWESQPLVVSRNDPEHYHGLLSTADVDQVIAFTRPKFVDAGVFSGEAAREPTYVQGWLADRPLQDGVRFPGIAELRRLYNAGKTVVIMTMQQRWLPIAHLCRNLESVFHCPVHANMYLTPPGAQGFDAHFDTHEVFVLQLEGSKHWRLYDSARTLPLVDERFNTPRDQLGPHRDVHLEAGDLLYLPRGHVHEAFTSECASLHLTVGVNVYRWADVLHEAVDRLTRRNERLRASIPPGLLGGVPAPSAIEGHVRELLELLARETDADEALRSLGDRFFDQLPVVPDTELAAARDPEAIGQETILERSPGILCRVVQNGTWVALEYPGGQLGGPLKIAAALKFVARVERFAVGELPELGPDARLLLARRLLREGLLRAAAEDERRETVPEGFVSARAEN